MKICPVCGKKLQGRIDKIYCTPKCKNAAQYEKRINNEQFYLFVDKQLKTNRRIVKKIFKIDFPCAKSTGRYVNFISTKRSKPDFPTL